MNFARAHKSAAYLVVWFAWLCLVMSGEIPALPVALSAAGVAASWWWEEPRVRVDRWAPLWSGLGVVVLAYSLLSLLTGGDLVLIGAELILFLQVAKLFGRRTSKDYQQVYILSFLMVVAATVLNSDVNFGVFFLGYVVTSTWALVLFHLRREIEDNLLVRHSGGGSQPVQVRRILGSRRIVGPRFFAGTGAVSLAVFAGATVLFLAIPRIGFGLFFDRTRSGVNLTGFSDGVRLGGHGVIKSDDTVVMRVEVDKPYAGRRAPYLRWRGVAFDHYQGGVWRRSRRAPRTRKRTAFDRAVSTYHLLYDQPRSGRLALGEDLVRQDIYLEPLGYDVLFGASMPQAFLVTTGYRQRRRDERNDEIRYPHQSGIRYTVYSRPERPPDELLRRPRRGPLPAGYEAYLQVPPEITDAVRAKAREVTAGAATDYDRALAVERWLQESFSYTLEMEGTGGREPIDFFLFERKKGHCEYFSSAMAIMLRTVGVPTRNVNGFLGGEWNEYDDYIAVRAGDAHSWVEVYLGEAGWVTFDPTPAADQLGRGGDGLIDRLRRFADTVRFKWFKWVIEYDLHQQLGFFRRIGDLLRGGGGSVAAPVRGARDWAREHRGAVAGGLFGAALLIAGILLWRRRRAGGRGGGAARRRERDPVAVLYLGTLRRLGRRGWPRGGSVTPREHARALSRAGAPGAAELAELTELYYAAEYGGSMDAAARSRAAELAGAIAAALRASRRRRV